MWRRWSKRLAVICLSLGAVAGLSACFWSGPLRAVLIADKKSGEAPLTVTFDLSKSTGAIAGFTLDFGDGQVQESHTDLTVPISHTYNDPGRYTVTFTIYDRNGRTSTDTLVIEVSYPPIGAELRADKTSGSAPLTVEFHISGQGALVKYTLDFGDGQVQDPPAFDPAPVTHTYQLPGTYTATLTVRDRWGREASSSLEIHVSQPVLRAVLEANPQMGPAPLQVSFDLSRSVGEISAYELDFGDGEGVRGSDITHSVVHTYVDPGTYTARFTVHDSHGNEDTATLTIRVDYPQLEALLDASPQTGSAPLRVTFDLSHSVGPINYFELDFGDGEAVNGTDITLAVIHTYAAPGDYLPTLTVFDIYGRSDSCSLLIRVH